MDPERWHQVARIYDAAVEQPTADRDAWLAHMCAGDDDLRREVESLLAQDDAEVLIDRPVWESAVHLLDGVAPLQPGTQLGPYRIEGLLGAGGMGQVYRASDTRLNRTVAIKVLADVLADDPAFRDRFDREARTIAALTHPHICTLHDVGHHDGIHFLVMEHVDGETLAERLARGPLPVPDALRYAVQIAEALASAHRFGVVHRDLKPGNIMLTRSGGARPGPPQAKLLDFGLAKTAAPAVVAAPQPSQTGDRDLTTPGTILGTFQYMAPEQLDGREADPRTDIFAFGMVFYEMLTGAKAFTGGSQASLIGAIIHAEAPSVSARQPLVPPAVDRVVTTCLAKDPDERWQNAGDLARELRWIASGGSTATPSPQPRGRWRRAAVLAAASLLVMALIAFATLVQRATPAIGGDVTRFPLMLPDGWSLPSLTVVSGSNAVTTSPLAISRDGRRIAFAARNASGTTQLWIRRLERVEPEPLAGTGGVSEPFWSPDGRFIAFFADGKLKKIEIGSALPIAICDAPAARGGSWGSGGTILFASGGLIHRVAAGGGTPSPVTETRSGEQTHLRPLFLPDGRLFLYSVFRPGNAHLVVLGAIDSTKRIELLKPDALNVGYSRGHVLFLRGTTLMAQPFDASRRAFSGAAIPVAERILTQPTQPTLGVFAASENGGLVYQQGSGASTSTLAWYGRNGERIGTLGEPANFGGVRFSPDGRRVAVNLLDDTANAGDIWVYDVSSGMRTRFTFDAPPENMFVWSPGGEQIAYGSHRTNPPSLVIKASNGSGGEDVISFETTPRRLARGRQPTDWSPDGRWIMFFAEGLWIVPATGDRTAVPWMATPGAQRIFGQFDPSARFVAYQSGEGGAPEVYVSSFPGPGGPWQISVAGGSLPRWRSDGREIYYFAPDDTLMAASVTTRGSSVHVDSVRPLFKAPRKLMSTRFGYSYDVRPGGSQFLINTVSNPRPAPLTVVLNWAPGL